MESARIRWAFRLAPLSSALVWGGGVIAGNEGWLAGWSTDSPVLTTVVMTAFTSALYMLSLPLLKRLYAWSRGMRLKVVFRLPLCGLLFGGAWGCVSAMIARSYLVSGPACGLVIGAALAVLIEGKGDGSRPKAGVD